MPGSGRQQEHVVGGGTKAGSRRQPHHLEQRVGLGQVDYPLDAHVHGTKSRSRERDFGPDARVQVRRRLLRD